MSNDLKQRAAELTVIAFNANAKGLWGPLRDDCLQAAHDRVLEALPRFDERKAKLSTFVGHHVAGAIKDELKRQQAGMIGTVHGRNYAPESLDTPSPPRYATGEDLAAARWHLASVDNGLVFDDGLSAPVGDSDTAGPDLGEARSTEDRSRKSSHEDGDDGLDKMAVALVQHAEPDEQRGSHRDNTEASAARRRHRDAEWRLDWEAIGERALASELFAPADRAAIATMGAEHFLEKVRWLRHRYSNDADERIAEAALYELLRQGKAELRRLERVDLAQTRQRAAEEADRLHKAVYGVAEVWFPYAGLRKRGKPWTQFRNDLRAFFASIPLEHATRFAKALPGALARHAKHFGRSPHK